MIKRFILFLAIYLFSLGTTQAQDQKFHFGMKISPTLAWLKPDTKEIDKGGPKIGFSYGIITEFNFQENYAIASGVQVTYRGGKLDFTENGTTETAKINLQYVEVPIALKMKTNEFSKIRYFGQFGMVPGFNIRAKEEYRGESDIDIKDDIRSFNLAMTIGIGAEYTLSGSTVLMSSLEFNNGFLDVIKSSDAKAYTNYFALNLAVLF